MQIHAPEAIPAGKVAETEILANVFNGSVKSIVEMRVGPGDWRTMTKTAVPDPALAAVSEREKALLELKKDAWIALPKARPSPHIWGAMLPAGLTPGTYAIEVRTTDMFGATHHGRRIIRVTEAQP
jgi:hypothetical protein